MAYNSDFDPAAIIRTASRLPERPKLSGAEIKRRAETLLLRPLSPELMKAYRLTATGGVLGLMHYRVLLKIKPRTIRKYTELGVLERLPDRTPTLRKIGFTESTEDLRLYTLGPVGYAMAEMEAITTPSGYHAVVDRVTHDFLATYVVVQFVLAADLIGLKWEWRNRYQASLTFEYSGGIEPDAAIRLTNPLTQKSFVFVLELHNEDHSKRSAEKLYRYRRASYSPKDHSPWWGQKQPVILVASPYQAPLTGYHLALSDPAHHAYDVDSRTQDATTHIPKQPVYGSTLQQMRGRLGIFTWRDLRTGEPTPLFKRDNMLAQK